MYVCMHVYILKKIHKLIILLVKNNNKAHLLSRFYAKLGLKLS